MDVNKRKEVGVIPSRQMYNSKLEQNTADMEVNGITNEQEKLIIIKNKSVYGVSTNEDDNKEINVDKKEEDR